MPSGQWGDDVEDFKHVIKSVFEEHLIPINDEEIVNTLDNLKRDALNNLTAFKSETEKDKFLQFVDILLHNVKSLGDKQKFIIYLILDIISD